MLSDVSFAIGAGEIVGLIGESVSGKTTLARIIAGLTAPDSGAVAWPGAPENVPVQKEITDLLLGLNHQTGLSILFITHDLALAAYACRRLVVLARGKVVEQGDTAAAVADPQSPETARLLRGARQLVGDMFGDG